MGHFGAPVFWIMILIVFLVIEMLTVGLTTIWLAGGSLVAFVLSVFGVPVIGQVIAFLIVSFVLVYFTRPWAMKYINNRKTKTNAESVIGQIVMVTEDINNLEMKGKVIANGLDWSARSCDDELQIKAGQTVRVLRIEGVKLIVEPCER